MKGLDGDPRKAVVNLTTLASDGNSSQFRVDAEHVVSCVPGLAPSHGYPPTATMRNQAR
jgi:hypothetical protein